MTEPVRTTDTGNGTSARATISQLRQVDTTGVQSAAQVARSEFLSNLERQRDEHAKTTRRYDAIVESIFAAQDQRRETLTELLEGRINRGIVTLETIEEEVAKLEAQVAQTGAISSWSFNPSSDPKYNRTQSFTLRLDDDGNIEAEYHPVSYNKQIGVTGRPVEAGKQTYMMNPYAKREIPREPFLSIDLDR